MRIVPITDSEFSSHYRGGKKTSRVRQESEIGRGWRAWDLIPIRRRSDRFQGDACRRRHLLCRNRELDS